MNWKPELQRVLGGNVPGIVTSPDIDGLLCAALVSKHTEADVLGTYDGKQLVLFDGASKEQARDAVWLDNDISAPGVRCVGQHLVHHQSTDFLPTRHSPSFNPNALVKQAWKGSFFGVQNPANAKRDKYPLATIHFLMEYYGEPDFPAPGLANSLLAHADGTWAACVDYRENALIWYGLMFPNRTGLFQDLVNGQYVANHLSQHAALVQDLLACGVSKGRSRMGKSQRIPNQWEPLEGHQKLELRGGAPPESTNRWFSHLVGTMGYVSSKTGWPLRAPTTFTKHPCDYDDVRPRDIPLGGFDGWMQSKGIFSHAFTGQGTLQFTRGPVL